MARIPRPAYMVSFGGHSDFEALLSSGDVAAMKATIAKLETWLYDPVNADDPQASEERKNLVEIKEAVARLEEAHVATAVA